MWHGIVNWLEGILDIESSTLQDAQFGITILGKLDFTCKNNVFEKNFTDIYVPVTDAGISDFDVSSVIEGNTFNGSPSLSGVYYSGQYPTPVDAKAYCGIWLNDLVGAFPDATASSTPNLFNDLHLGIMGIHSNLDGIYNCRFERIQPYQGYLNYQRIDGGAAIYSANNTSSTLNLDIGNQNTGSAYLENTFLNCQYGIYGVGKLNTIILNNNFVHTTWTLLNLPSIYLSNLRNRTIDIEHNTFDDAQYYHSQFGFPTTNSFFSTGIYISNGASATQHCDVSWNTFNNMRIGIYTNNCDGNISDPDFFSIHDNFINSTFPHSYIQVIGANHYGIWANNSHYVSIGANNIDRGPSLSGAASSFENMMLGLNMKNVQLSRICYNHVYNYGTAARFLSNCDNTEFQCNYMTTCVKGVRLDVAAFSQQGSSNLPSDNKWLGFPTPTSTSYNRVVGTPPSPADWYYRDDPNTPSLSNDFSPEPAATYVITPHAFTSGILCQQSTEQQKLFDLMHKIIGDSIIYNEYVDENKYMAEDFVFRILDADASIRSMYPEFESFYEEYKQFNIGEYNVIDSMITSEDFTEALELLDQIQDENTIEYNKTVTISLAIQELSADGLILNEDQIAELIGIANTTAWIGGEGVFNARHLLFAEVDDRENNLRESQPQNNRQNSSTPEFSLYPNPAQDYLTIFVSESNSSDSKAEIYDLTGRRIKSQSMLNNIIDIRDLQPGLYTIHFSSCGNRYTVARFEIVR